MFSLLSMQCLAYKLDSHKQLLLTDFAVEGIDQPHTEILDSSSSGMPPSHFSQRSLPIQARGIIAC